MSKLGDLFVRLGLKKDDFERGLKSAQKSTETFGSKLKNALSSTVGRFASLTAAIALVGSALKSAIHNIATFERANATLASVLGTTTKEISDLSKSAKELGRTTEFTATNVTELQTALARLGFDKNQIMSMQQSVLKFASAVGTDLASAADFTGSALRAFGLQATDTQKLLDIMAASTSKSALDFSKLATSISIVAPVAKAFGLTANETASFLGVLANNGFDASSAATALRNILLNLSDSNGKLAQGIGHSAKSFDQIIEAFGELTAKGVKVDEVLGMTDKRSAAAALSIIANADAVRNLNKELTNCSGTLDNMYETMTDNVIGAANNLKSAWEGLTLAFENSKGPIKTVLQMLADGMNDLTAFIEGTWQDRQFEKDVDRRVKFFKDKGYEYIDYLKEIANQENYINEQRKKGYDTQFAEYSLRVTKGAKEKLFGQGAPSASPSTTTPTTTPTITTPDLTDEQKRRIENEKKTAALIAKAAHEAVIGRKQALKEEYEENKAALEKYGIDTSELTRKYMADLLDIVTESKKQLQDAGHIEFDWGIDANMESIDEDLAAETDLIVENMERAIAAMEEFKEAVAVGFSNACQEMMDQLMGVESFNMGAVIKALLEPLADLAIKEGEILLATGTGVEACKKALESLNGYAAIAAGAALIAIGTAAKAGLSALAKGGSANTTSSTYSGGASSADAQGIETELTIHVEGHISGSDIVLAGQKTINNWNR